MDPEREAAARESRINTQRIETQPETNIPVRNSHWYGVVQGCNTVILILIKGKM
jgi:hypothetical protein